MNSMVALVCGCGPDLENDLSDAMEIAPSFDVVCCINGALNRYACATLSLPDVWYSYHADLLSSWDEFDAVQKLSCNNEFSFENVMLDPLENTLGSSALQAVRLLIRSGYDKIVLAGVPLSGRYNDTFFGHWIEAREEIFGKVKSFSGMTRALLGYPNWGWLNGL